MITHQLRVHFVALLALVVVTGAACSGSPTSPTATQPGLPVVGVPPVPPGTQSDVVAELRNANPAIMGTEVNGVCPRELARAGTLKPEFSIWPGGTPVRIFLVDYDDRSTAESGCGMEEKCGDRVLYTEDSSGTRIKAAWQVKAGRYCVRVVNRSEALQTLNGPVIFEWIE